MSDDFDDEQEFEVDVNHPWVHASTVMRPQPVPTSVSMDACEWREAENEEPKKAALLTVIDATGVKNVFLPPAVLQGLMQQGGAIIQQWMMEEMAKPKITVADKNIERAVIEEQKIHKAARDGKSNPFRSV